MMDSTEIQKIISDVTANPGVDMNRIDPKVMTAIMAMAQAGQLTRIRKNLEDRTSEGWTQGFVMTITDAPPGEGWKLDRPAQSISLTNDGPNPVLVALNDNDNPTIVNVNGVHNVNFEAHKLERVFLQCAVAGAATNIRFLIKG